MPTREITLTEHFDNFIASGAEDQAKMEWLRSVAQESVDSLERGEGKSFASIDELAGYIRKLARQTSTALETDRSGAA